MDSWRRRYEASAGAVTGHSAYEVRDEGERPVLRYWVHGDSPREVFQRLDELQPGGSSCDGPDKLNGPGPGPDHEHKFCGARTVDVPPGPIIQCDHLWALAEDVDIGQLAAAFVIRFCTACRALAFAPNQTRAPMAGALGSTGRDRELA